MNVINYSHPTLTPPQMTHMHILLRVSTCVHGFSVYPSAIKHGNGKSLERNQSIKGWQFQQTMLDYRRVFDIHTLILDSSIPIN